MSFPALSLRSPRPRGRIALFSLFQDPPTTTLKNQKQGSATLYRARFGDLPVKIFYLEGRQF